MLLWVFRIRNIFRSRVLKCPRARLMYRICSVTGQPNSWNRIQYARTSSCLDVVRTLTGEKHMMKVQQVPISNDTVSHLIGEMVSDVEAQVIESIKQSPKFAIAMDESCDVAGYLSLRLSWGWQCRCVGVSVLYWTEHYNYGKGHSDAVTELFPSRGLSWSKYITGCTDSAREMTGKVKVFITLIRQVNNITFTHCMIHRKARASNELCAELTVVIIHVVRTINSIKWKPKAIRLFKLLCRNMGAAHEHLLLHTEVRWLSRGNALRRMYELGEELVAFLAGNQL